MNEAELERLELGTLHPVVIPELTRRPDGRLRVGCRKGCPLPATTDLALVIQMLVGHIEVGS